MRPTGGQCDSDSEQVERSLRLQAERFLQFVKDLTPEQWEQVRLAQDAFDAVGSPPNVPEFKAARKKDKDHEQWAAAALAQILHDEELRPERWLYASRALMALAERRAMTGDQFVALYRPFAAVIPLKSLETPDEKEGGPVELVGFHLAAFPMRLKFYCLACLEREDFWGKRTRRAGAIVRFPDLQSYKLFPPSLCRAVQVTRLGGLLDRRYRIDDRIPLHLEAEIYLRAMMHGLLLVPAVPMPYVELKCTLCGTEP